MSRRSARKKGEPLLPPEVEEGETFNGPIGLLPVGTYVQEGPGAQPIYRPVPEADLDGR